MKKLILVMASAAILSIINFALVHSVFPDTYNFNIIIISVLFFGLTFLCLWKLKQIEKPSRVLCALLIGMLVIELSLKMSMGMYVFRLSIPDLLCKIAAILFAYAIFKTEKLALKVIWTILTIFALFGFRMWGQTAINEHNRMQVLENPIKCDITFQDSKCDTVTLEGFKDKLVVLYFWTSHCELCDDEFPVVESLYNITKNTSSAVVYGVFCRNEALNESCRTGSDILYTRNYNFPFLSVSKENNGLQAIATDNYPFAAIMNGNGDIIFQGNIYDVKKMAITYIDAN